ncbi:glycosyltransferase family 22 protein [Athelia psychrophila]|uniref:Mannosyltransferase n=1 Tax=Athelia psychrophila TaxID=1759441 RepID=A0A166JUV0_9AGAM|nr:glycosyltransferase family 22 protein [Fibularhizoctonia sp. CBS 109695]
MASLRIFVRILIALSTRTFFQPDEYYQALEPAHALVFGYGHLTWEWLTPQPIRSVIYPALNLPIYWLLKVTGLHTVWPSLVVIGPKLLHGSLAAATDVWVRELAVKTIGEKYASVTLFLSLTSLFHALSLSRSLSNSLETSLTTIALALFPWDPASHSFTFSDKNRFSLCLLFAALACTIRPTNAIIWVYMFSYLCWHLRGRLQALAVVVGGAVVTGTLSLCAISFLDYLYYSKLTITHLNFLLTNLSSVSLFYGSNPWHFYIFQAIPILCTTSLPFVLFGAWKAVSRPGERRLKVLLGCIVWTISVYSMAGHKEWRFIHPLLPLLHILAAKYLVDAYARPSPGADSRTSPLPIRQAHMWLILSAIPAALYIVVLHASPQISVMAYLRSVPSNELRSVGFLTPCHSTPWQAYLHRPDLAEPGRLWALGCEPPLGVQNRTSYLDQTDIFFESPREYLENNFPPTVDTTYPPSPFPASPPGIAIEVADGSTGPWKHEWPKNLVMFGALLQDQDVKALVEALGYSEVWRAGWDWEGEGKRRAGVRVLQHLSSSK